MSGIISKQRRRNSSGKSRIGIAALLFALALPGVVYAQRTIPFSEDALVLGFREMRAGVQGTWQYYDQLYSGDDGTLRPFASELSFSSTGTTQFPGLSAHESVIRSLSAQNSFAISLGATTARASHRSATTTFSLNFGLPGRLMLTADVPIVRLETSTIFSANGDLNTANVGINPAIGNTPSFAADTALGNQFARAQAALSAQLATCLGSSASNCTTINSRRSEAQALVASAATLSAGILFLSTSPIVPLALTSTQTAITTRIAATASAFRDFGINTITGTTVAPATAPLSGAQFRHFLASAEGGNGGLRSFRSLTRIGDMSVGAKLRITNTEQLRSAAFAKVYIPTGGKPSATELYPFIAGEGVTRAEFGGVADVFIGKRMSVSAMASLMSSFASDIETRSASPGITGTPIIATSNGRTGFNFTVTPGYAINRWLSFGAQFQSRRQSAQTFSSETGGELAVWNQQPESTSNTIGAGLAFSNLPAAGTKGTRFPFEASFFHSQTISGSGLQPKYFTEEVRFRLYSFR